MIYHITYQDSGGINSYVNNLIAGSPQNQQIILINRNTAHTCFKDKLRLKQNEDTLIFHDPKLCKSFFSTIKHRTIICLHGDNPYYYGATEELGLFVNGIICVSSNIALGLNQRFHNKVTTIGPSILAQSKPKFHRQPPHPRIIFIGREEKNKGSQLLPEIDKYIVQNGIIPKWTIILGSRPESQATFRNWLTEANDRITVFEALSKDNLSVLLRKQDCLVLPSMTEGHPMVVIEALANGIAPLTTHYCHNCTSHFPVDPEGIVYPSNNTSELAHKIVAYTQQPEEKIQRWQAAAVEFVRTNHCPKTQFDRLYKFQESLTPTRKTKRRLIALKWKRRILRYSGLW